MKPLAVLPLLAALALPPLAGAQSAAPGATTFGLVASHERLSNGSPDWSEYGIRIARSFDARRNAEVALTQTSRFGLIDDQLRAAGALPLSQDLTLSLEGNVSSSHRVLARHAVGAMLQWEFARAWLLHGGLRTSSYDSTSVDQGILMLEHYVGNFSVLGALRPTRALGTTANSQEVRGNWYYGERNRIGLSWAWGREATSLPATVVLAEVRALSLVGRHQLDRRWSLDYALANTRQGSFYTRRGIGIGLNYSY